MAAPGGQRLVAPPVGGVPRAADDNSPPVSKLPRKQFPALSTNIEHNSSQQGSQVMKMSSALMDLSK